MFLRHRIRQMPGVCVMIRLLQVTGSPVMAVGMAVDLVNRDIFTGVSVGRNLQALLLRSVDAYLRVSSHDAAFHRIL